MKSSLIMIVSENCYFLGSKKIIRIPNEDKEIDFSFANINTKSFRIKTNSKQINVNFQTLCTERNFKVLDKKEIVNFFKNDIKNEQLKLYLEVQASEDIQYKIPFILDVSSNNQDRNKNIVDFIKKIARDSSWYIYFGISIILGTLIEYQLENSISSQSRKKLFQKMMDYILKGPDGLLKGITFFTLPLGLILITVGLILFGYSSKNNNRYKVNRWEPVTTFILGFSSCLFYVLSIKNNFFNSIFQLIFVIEAIFITRLLLRICRRIINWIEDGNNGANVTKLTFTWTILSAILLGLFKLFKINF